jgi:hypothetical protein
MTERSAEENSDCSNVTAHMSRQQPRGRVISAADGIADHNRDIPPREEISILGQRALALTTKAKAQSVSQYSDHADCPSYESSRSSAPKWLDIETNS